MSDPGQSALCGRGRAAACAALAHETTGDDHQPLQFVVLADDPTRGPPPKQESRTLLGPRPASAPRATASPPGPIRRRCPSPARSARSPIPAAPAGVAPSRTPGPPGGRRAASAGGRPCPTPPGSCGTAARTRRCHYGWPPSRSRPWGCPRRRSGRGACCPACPDPRGWGQWPRRRRPRGPRSYRSAPATHRSCRPRGAGPAGLGGSGPRCRRPASRAGVASRSCPSRSPSRTAGPPRGCQFSGRRGCPSGRRGCRRGGVPPWGSAAAGAARAGRRLPRVRRAGWAWPWSKSPGHSDRGDNERSACRRPATLEVLLDALSGNDTVS